MTDGARKVAVPVVCSLESVPKDPSVGQALAVAVTDVPEELVVVVVYVQPTQVTSVFAGPTTVAVRVVDWPKISVLPTDEVTDTEVTVAPLLLPHPEISKLGTRTASAK